MPNVIEILEDRLRVLGADGLCTQDCGCSIGDLAPCGSWIVKDEHGTLIHWRCRYGNDAKAKEETGATSEGSGSGSGRQSASRNGGPSDGTGTEGRRRYSS